MQHNQVDFKQAKVFVFPYNKKTKKFEKFGAYDYQESNWKWAMEKRLNENVFITRHESKNTPPNVHFNIIIDQVGRTWLRRDDETRSKMIMFSPNMLRIWVNGKWCEPRNWQLKGYEIFVKSGKNKFNINVKEGFNCQYDFHIEERNNRLYLKAHGKPFNEYLISADPRFIKSYSGEIVEEKEKEKEKKKEVCVVCLDKKHTHIFPCGHLCVCENCGSKLNKCPMCQQPGKANKVYYPH